MTHPSRTLLPSTNASTTRLERRVPPPHRQSASHRIATSLAPNAHAIRPPPRQSRGINTRPCRGVSRNALSSFTILWPQVPTYPPHRPSNSRRRPDHRRQTPPIAVPRRTEPPRHPAKRPAPIYGTSSLSPVPDTAHRRPTSHRTTRRSPRRSPRTHIPTVYHAASTPDRVGAFRETPCAHQRDIVPITVAPQLPSSNRIALDRPPLSTPFTPNTHANPSRLPPGRPPLSTLPYRLSRGITTRPCRGVS